MGCTSSDQKPNPELEREQQLDKQIQSEMDRARSEGDARLKLLILGAGDSGKTTFRKQLRNVYMNGFPPSVRLEYSHVIVSNFVEGLQSILAALPGLKLSLGSESLAAAAFISALPFQSSKLTNDIVANARKVLADPAVVEAIKRRNEFQLQDCWHSFASQLVNYPAWGGPNWIPSVADCVASRVRTTGVIEETFMVDGIPFELIDVGGQRAERKKWISCFSEVSAVIYIVSISEYDQSLYEDHSINRVIESLNLFTQTLREKALADVSFILFLNKRDLFDAKIKHAPLDATLSKLPGCPSGLVDAKTASDWLASVFVSAVPVDDDGKPQKQLFVHYTTATDQDNIKKVFQDCKNILLRQSMASAGFNVA